MEVTDARLKDMRPDIFHHPEDSQSLVGQHGEGGLCDSSKRRCSAPAPNIRRWRKHDQKGVLMKPAPVKPHGTIEDLKKLDIRVGTIEAVDDVEGSKKLVKLTVNFGDHTRSILAGMKQEREDPSEIVGKQALFVVNLPPRTMAGLESQGMLFDLGYEDGVTPVLAVPEFPVPDGTRAG